MAKYIVELIYLGDYNTHDATLKFLADLSKDEVMKIIRDKFKFWKDKHSEYGQLIRQRESLRGNQQAHFDFSRTVEQWWYDQRTIHEFEPATKYPIVIPTLGIENYGYRIYTLDEWFSGTEGLIPMRHF